MIIKVGTEIVKSKYGSGKEIFVIISGVQTEAENQSFSMLDSLFFSAFIIQKYVKITDIM